VTVCELRALGCLQDPVVLCVVCTHCVWSWAHGWCGWSNFTRIKHTYDARKRLLKCELAHVCGAELKTHLLYAASVNCACGLRLRTPPCVAGGVMMAFGGFEQWVPSMAALSLAVVMRSRVGSPLVGRRGIRQHIHVPQDSAVMIVIEPGTRSCGGGGQSEIEHCRDCVVNTPASSQEACVCMLL